MSAFAKELLTRIFVLAVLVCAFPAFACLFYGWAIKTFLIDDWSIF